MARNPLSRKVELWEVTVRAHHIPPRYDVPEKVVRMGGSELFCKKTVLSDAQADAGVPPWKPYRRLGWPHVSARRVELDT